MDLGTFLFWGEKGGAAPRLRPSEWCERKMSSIKSSVRKGKPNTSYFPCHSFSCLEARTFRPDEDGWEKKDFAEVGRLALPADPKREGKMPKYFPSLNAEPFT